MVKCSLTAKANVHSPTSAASWRGRCTLAVRTCCTTAFCLTPQHSLTQSEVGGILAGSGALGAAAAAFASVALAPTLEELVYRGFLLPSLTRRLPPPLAVSAATVNKQNIYTYKHIFRGAWVDWGLLIAPVVPRCSCAAARLPGVSVF